MSLSEQRSRKPLCLFTQDLLKGLALAGVPAPCAIPLYTVVWEDKGYDGCVLS